MPTPLPSRPLPSARDLRASLLAPPVPPPNRATDQPGPAAPPAPPAPSPSELLSTSPAVVRLCESYHRSQAQMIARGRRQRLGIFLLVCGVGVGAVLLWRSGALTAALVSDLVLAAAGASAVSVGLLGLLWLRDEQRLRGIQGERLLRALQSSCTLPAERLHAFRRGRDPVAAFFECYATWRSNHATGRGIELMKLLRHTRA